MNKGTKIITTAISLVLVLSFMVVGILAATSATASISSSISWTADIGLEFTLDAWTWHSAEHYDENSKSFPETSPHKIEQIVVDTATTNQQASGISKSLNANFIDTTDDGVNNPHEIYYIYMFSITDTIEDDDIVSLIDIFPQNAPTSTSEVDVQYCTGCKNAIEGFKCLDFSTGCNWKSSPNNVYSQDFTVFVMKLTLKNANNSLTSFNASIGFNIRFGMPGV